MIEVLNHIRKLDWIIAVTAGMLVCLGLASIYGSSGSGLDFKKQILFFAIGIILMIAVSFFDWRVLKEDSYLVMVLYSFGIMLVLGLFVFAPAVRGVRRWYSVGLFSFDPVEYIKIVLIILLAKYFSERHVEMYKFSHIVFSGIYVALPAAITFFQPDLGSAIILIALWLGILILSGIKTKHLFILLIIGVILFSLGWAFMLKDYQKARIAGFLEPRLDPQGINWNPEQAKIAIGSGGFFGQGIGKGPQTQYGFLPEAKTDFIFSAIAEEMGFFGVFIIFLLFSLIFWRILKIALMCTDNFSRLFCSGFVMLLLSQVFINIAMNQGLLPIVGIPLPLVSYGGSNLVFTFIGIGIIQSIKASLGSRRTEFSLAESY